MSDLVERLMYATLHMGRSADIEAVKEALALLASQAAELSRLSALVAEWEKAAEPFVAVAQNDIGECEADADFFRPIGIKYARVKLLTVGDFRRLSQLKDTTNADK